MTDRAIGFPLGQLFPGVAMDAAEIDVTGLAYDSRMVRPGDLFFALSGSKADGARFAASAVRAGAVAVVTGAPLPVGVPTIVVPLPRRTMAEIAHRFYGHPDRLIDLVGVVGTNGKSTVAAGLQTVWESAGISAGLVGTVAHRWGKVSIAATRTTPEAPDLDRLLAQMQGDGVRRVAMEVSSHALVLDRVWGLNYRGGIFTNLTRDHLDFHGTFENYRAAKRLFFERLDASDCFAAINVDDPSWRVFAEASAAARLIRYSANCADADLRLTIVMHDLSGTRGRLIYKHQSWPFESPLWGRFNHSNLAAIAAGAIGSGVDGAVVARGLSGFHGVPGRAERINSAAPYSVFVDYAHTPDALRAVLGAARPLVRGRLLVLFGCGGDRDRGKRPEMAQAVERWADRIYLTSDNPRSEDPGAIINEVKAGFTPSTLESKVWCNPDRARAIAQAVADAQPGDGVFLCGKGHEDTQDVAGVVHPFSDRDVVAGVLTADAPPGGGGSHPRAAVDPGGDPPPTERSPRSGA